MPVESTVLRGSPAPTLLEYAGEIDADLVVAGQRGAGGITGALLGSTTDRLARLTDRPLVVVPAGVADTGNDDDAAGAET